MGYVLEASVLNDRFKRKTVGNTVWKRISRVLPWEASIA